MAAFEFMAPSTQEEAHELLSNGNVQVKVMSGGTDLLGEIKESVVRPSAIVSLTGVNGMSGIESTPEGLRIGALTTVAEIESSAEIAENYTALAQAAAVVATQQIRNVGTVGGNLCQRPRCWYYRSPSFNCRKKGGDECFAFGGMNKFHAIINYGDCCIVHPSDLAVPLISLDAKVTIVGDETRTVPIEDFFAGPSINIQAENILRPGEILASVTIPRPSAGTRSVFLKAKERQAMDFALSSVAIALDILDDTIADARIALGGVSPTPYRVPHAEEALKGQKESEVLADEIGVLAVRDARPLSDNGYKVRLTASLVRRALEQLLDQNPQ